ncbi:four helix bundle protein [Nibrella viscosa]|uniref:Four helix bundle protein n=1 Tax=Nibrella viscosa TaxID=1084524 RepID=A0ABP8JR97_9BACT
MGYQNFTELEVYKECRQFRMGVSALVKSCFPPDEKFRLSDQIIRSSRSITANIAEGHGRHYYKENIQFCRTSRASLSETLEHLITAFDEKYISNEQLLDYKAKVDLCGRLLNGYITFLKKQQKPREEGG